MGQLQDRMRVVSSIKELIATALKHAPEAAAAWGGVCLLLQVLRNLLDEASTNRSGISYIASRIDWYWNLSPLLLNRDQQEKLAGL